MQLAHRTVLITGAASGLGAACARLFHELNANVVLCDANEPGITQLAGELGDRVANAAGDVCSEAEMQRAIALAGKQFGELHGLVHCAGILAASRVVGRDAPHDLALFRRVIEVNLVGTFNVARLAAAAMQHNHPTDDGERGVLIFTSSVAAFEGQLGQAAYAAAKGGVASLTLPLARELGQHGIRVVSIAPGVIETPMMQAAPVQVRESLASQIPFPPRFGQPSEFAALAAHIFANPFINGTTLRLDGALRMGAK